MVANGSTNVFKNVIDELKYVSDLNHRKAYPFSVERNNLKFIAYALFANAICIDSMYC